MMFGFGLSGLQEFLYDLSPEDLPREQRSDEGGRERNAARRLRIRSAILTLVPGLVAWELRRHDRDAEITYLGGGKLFMTVKEAAVEAIESKLIELYEFLAHQSSGKLGAYWAVTAGNGGDVASVKALRQELALAKWRAGRPDGWHRLAGKIHETRGTDSLGDTEWESSHGAEFARREDWVGFRVGEGDWQIGPWRARPVTCDPDVGLAGKVEAPVSVCIPTYTPKKDQETVPLYELAERDAAGNPRPGGAYLALLKLDGDGIGSLMAQALDEGIGRYRALSEQVSTFFGPDLMAFLKASFPRLYLVYSGGDDLVATGHFDDVIRACLKIRDRFHERFQGNTVSAGISFYDRNSPILKAVEVAEEELESAKETRDAVSLGGCRLEWEELRKTIREVDGIVDAISAGSINRGALQLLRQLGEPWLRSPGQVAWERRWRSIPLMHYMRCRRTEWKESEWPVQVKELFDSLQAKAADWPRAALVGTLATWRTKRREEDQ